MTEGNGYKEVQLGPKKVKIPLEWTVKRVNEIFEVKAGGDIEKEKFSENKDEDHPYPIFANSLENKGLYGYSSDYSYPEDCITITGRGSLGKAFHREKKFNAIVRLIVLIPKIELAGTFVAEYINERVNFWEESTGVPQLTRPQVKKSKISLPPVEEQNKIAKILSTVDKAIQKTEEIIERSKELKKGLMQDLLTKGIGHEEFKEVQLGPKQMEVPVNWNPHKLDKLNTRTKPICYGVLKPGKHDKNGIPLIKIENIEGNHLSKKEMHKITEELDEEYSRSRITGGEVLLSIQGTIGRTAIVPESFPNANISRTIARITPTQENNNVWLKNYLLSRQARDFMEVVSSGSTRASLNIGDLREFPVVRPPLPEQKKIANILSTVDQKIQKEKDYKEKLEELKKGLMQDLLTGKVRVLPLLSDEEKEELKEANVPG